MSLPDFFRKVDEHYQEYEQWMGSKALVNDKKKPGPKRMTSYSEMVIRAFAN